MTGRLPSFLIVGAARSGTTSLFRYLLEHPEVFLPRIKEIHFFDDRYHLGLPWYADQFARGFAFRQIGEATPNYMYDPVAMERIGHDLPGARLVVILRNPIDRAYSQYLHNRAVGREQLSFEEALVAEPQRLLGSGQDRRTYSYVDQGRYHRSLEAILRHFSLESVCVLIFDDLVKDPRSVFGGLCGFLGVDPGFVPKRLGRAVNAHVEFRSLLVRRLSKRLPRPAYRLIGRFNAKRLSRPLAPPTERARTLVTESLIDELHRTSHLVGRDLTSLWLGEKA